MEQQEQLENLIMYRFSELQKIVSNTANKAFTKGGFGIQVEQVPVLMIPFYKKTISQQEIADFTGRDKSSVLRSINSLANKGLVITENDPFDKRRKLIQLTKSGKAMAHKIQELVIEVDGTMFSCLDEQEKKTFINLLKKCSEHLGKQ